MNDRYHHSRLIYRIDRESLCQLGCYLTYEQATMLVDFADPQYHEELSSLIVRHDVIAYERLNTLFDGQHHEIHVDTFTNLILRDREV